MTKRGRPKTDTSAVMVRINKDMLDAVDAECQKHPDSPSRPEMIRRIISDWLQQNTKDRG